MRNRASQTGQIRPLAYSNLIILRSTLVWPDPLVTLASLKLRPPSIFQSPLGDLNFQCLWRWNQWIPWNPWNLWNLRNPWIPRIPWIPLIPWIPWIHGIHGVHGFHGFLGIHGFHGFPHCDLSLFRVAVSAFFERAPW